MQTLTNILYIKIPVFDPDRLLQRMLRWVGWIFSLWFFALSVGLMVSAGLLILTHFETFRAKLPEQQVFFRFQTVVYMWAALGVVKVIHEFGHGLSCKVFGGEVHEMGALLLCLSLALYRNVSDAWTLPNKWHRIIISAAGIYVELVIAAIATFVWWNTPTQPFINNLALSLIVVCSVSTVVFNANPLMRYDGYYVLADWLEIPNLRERSNRFLKNLTLEHCLGIEVVPEPYMALWRRILFVSYAVGSYIYRWVVTFAILWFLYSFLRPYKLEVISQMLALGAAASMAGWPLYRLGKAIYRRGRLPDMKKWRVLASLGVLTALVLFVCLVPVPVSRIRGRALVQAQPSATGKVYVHHDGLLTKLNVRPGDKVTAGDELAAFSDRELDTDLLKDQTERFESDERIKALQRKQEGTNDQREIGKITTEIGKLTTKRAEADTRVKGLEKTRDEELVLRAPCAGIIGHAPLIDDIGKFFPADPNTPFCTINEPSRVCICMPIVTPEFHRLKDDLEQLDVTIRIQGRDNQTWKGKIRQLPESEAKTVPLALSNRAGGPVAVKAGAPGGTLIPAMQQYLVYIDILDADEAMLPGTLAQVKIHCQPETCLHWLWRTLNNTFDLGLM
jgi:putative peptide zinc metalloprotease protein